MVLLGGARHVVSTLAASLVGGAGYLIQRRLDPTSTLAGRFGPRLWSVRLLVLATPAGPLIHRAAAEIATGTNPADNYWRAGNRIDAIELDTGRLTRVVTGTGLDLREDSLHSDTGQLITGTAVPGWAEIVVSVQQAAQAAQAAQTFAGIRTQSWNVAVSDPAPAFLEPNFGGDLSLHQLAHGQGVLDGPYRDHLRRCGYQGRL